MSLTKSPKGEAVIQSEARSLLKQRQATKEKYRGVAAAAFL